MRHALLRIAATFAFLLQPLVANADAKQQIEAHFQKKLFYIRNFYRDDQLVYDAQGNVEGQPQSGPWSLALVQIEKVEVRNDEFRLQGRRAAAIYDAKQKKFRQVIPNGGGKIKIVVRTPPDTLSDSELNAISDRLFLTKLTGQDLPETWRNFFMGKERISKDFPMNIPIPDLESDGQPVFRVSPKDGMTPPKPLATPDPRYEEIARESKIQGTTVLNVVVNRQGTTEHIEVVRPLGIGLDDSAIRTVSNWRFQPATMSGQPVAVLISVEVEFRLY